MLKLIKNWLGKGKVAGRGDALRKTGAHRPAATPRPNHQTQAGARRRDAVKPAGPAPLQQAPVIRNKFVREDTGTHETLKILDDSIIDSGEKEGFDPYNTGDFDRSRNWERRFRD